MLSERRFDRHLQTVSYVWAHRLSGVLEAEFPVHQRRERIQFSVGGIVKRAQFTTLNAALRSERLVFLQLDDHRSSDWRSVGRLLYSQAYSRVLRMTPEDGTLPVYATTCPLEVLAALPVEDVEGLLQNVQGMATFDERSLPLRALALMGLLQKKDPRVEIDAEIDAAYLEADALGAMGWGLDGICPRGIDLDQCTAAVSTTPEQMYRYWIQLRQSGAPSCRRVLEQALLHNMEQPALLAFLGVCWLADVDCPLNKRVENAQRWIQFAVQLDVSGDLEVEKCLHTVQRLCVQLPADAVCGLPRALQCWVRAHSERSCNSTRART